MGSQKERPFDIEQQLEGNWIAENYPDVVEETDEWKTAAQEYRWLQDWFTDMAEQQRFEISLASIPARLEDARAELQNLSDLLRTGQPGIVLRMALVHAVTVLDSFLMYSARALLIHPEKLAAYQLNAARLVRYPKDRNALQCPKWFEQQPDVDTPPVVYRWRAQAQVERVTFQTESVIRDHFSVLLDAPVDWPLALLKPVVTMRNDLVHRNGVTVRNERVYVSQERVEHAITCISQIVEAAGMTLVQDEESIVKRWSDAQCGTDN